MKVDDFFREWTGQRPNLCTAFHEAGIEAMAFAEAYHKAELQANGDEQSASNCNIPLVLGRSEQLVCPDCKSKARFQNGFIWCENDDCGGIYRAN